MSELVEYAARETRRADHGDHRRFAPTSIGRLMGTRVDGDRDDRAWSGDAHVAHEKKVVAEAHQDFPARERPANDLHFAIELGGEAANAKCAVSTGRGFADPG